MGKASTIQSAGEIKYTLFRGDHGFTIRVFKPFEDEETLLFPNGKPAKRFNIKGYHIPDDPATVVLNGNWESYKGSYTFNVDLCSEYRIRDKDAIIKYLRSLHGVGKGLARRIYRKFGDDVYDILDADITRLKEVRGIGKRKFTAISMDYLSRGAAKELHTYLYKYNVHPKKINDIYETYGENSINVIREQPHKFYLTNKLSFSVAERISREENADALSDPRIEACVYETIKKHERKGNVYIRWVELVWEVINLIGLDGDRAFRKSVGEKIRDIVKSMDGLYIDVEKEKGTGDTILYTRDASFAEYGSAQNIRAINVKKIKTCDCTKAIQESQKKLGVKLSKEQEKAVQMVMNANFSIVTGGPGTGKTTFQAVLLDVFKTFFPKKEVLLGAPTGRAAKKMSENAGYQARTLHSILGLIASDDGSFVEIKTEKKEKEEQEIISPETGLIIVDETSMLDIFISQKLFEAVKNSNARIVCIGDVHQLPSVGPGTVLKSLIDSKAIPFTRFTKIFRQKSGSCIAKNAGIINRGETNLEFNKDFCFTEKNGSDQIAKEAVKQYRQAIKEFGVDDVTLLTPFRKKTVTGVNKMNPELKKVVNPYPEKVTRNNKIDGKEIYLNDRVMISKNYSNFTNGDVGYVTDIYVKDNIQYAEVTFDDGRTAYLTDDHVDWLTPAYATTVHKSQGSEYACVIILIDPAHSSLLQRNLIYTAITRAKKKVVLIGSKDALNEGIRKEEALKRESQLESLIKKE